MTIRRHKLSRDIWALGFVSLFMDVSSEIIHGLLPVFLVSVLGASLTAVGFLEGAAEGTALILKVVSGTLSDRLGRRKQLVVLGYTLSTISKPFFALARSVPMVFGARLFDRMGKGIRGAPRDALIADIVPPQLRGGAFGLRQALDSVGAFLGPAMAILLMWLTGDDYRLVFWLAVLPALLAVSILLLGVRENRGGRSGAVPQPIHFRDLKQFTAGFWFVTGAGALFQLARLSEAFLILRARDFGLSFAMAPLVLIVMNIVYSLSSYPVGYLSDRIRREWFLFAGLFTLCLAETILGVGGGLGMVFVGIGLWGLQLGLTQGILAALVADHCAPQFRGTAYGIFNLFSALALLLASVIAGILWDLIGPQATFFTGAGFSLISFLAFIVAGIFFKRR